MNKWYEEAFFYQMYPLGMTGADKYNSGERIEYKLAELENWSGHLKSLGVNAIYIGPLFQSISHGYDTTDYYQLDSRLGDNNTLKNFINKYHSEGIKVVLDGVFNHTGRDFFAFKDIKENGQDSKYRYWYQNIDFNNRSPYNDNFSYEGWRGCYELVKLNLENQEVRDYLLNVIRFWIDEFGIDGIRLDCADSLNFSFMQQMKAMTKSISDDFWIMGEVIHGDYSRWVNNEMLDSVTNYEMHKGLYSSHNDYNYFEIAYTAKREFNSENGIYKNLSLYNFVDNHDVDRLASKLNNINHIYNVYGMMFTLPGIPSIYYGSEWGIEGKKDGPNDDYLRPYVNINDISINNQKLLDFIREIEKVRKENKALIIGDYLELYVSNKQYSFARNYENKTVVCAFNCADEVFHMCIPLEKINLNGGKLSKLFGGGYNCNIYNNNLYVSLPPYENTIIEL